MSRVRKAGKALKENRIVILGFILVVFAFYYTLVRSGITTHDELSNLLDARINTFFGKLVWGGRWSLTLMNAIPSYLHALAENQWVYRLFTIIGLLIACGGFAMLLQELTDRKITWIALLLFFMFAQIQLDHDGLIAFSFGYQFNTVYAFISLALFHRWLYTRKTKLLIFSAVLYLLGCMAYESFVGYGVLFLILDLFYLKEQGRIQIRDLFRDLGLHAALAIIYVAQYVIVRKLSGFQNSDSTVGSGFTIAEVLKTNWKLAFGLFPLNYKPMGWRQLAKACLAISGENLLRWGLVIFLGYVIYQLVIESREIGWMKYLQMTVFCAAGVFLPGAPAAVTNQMIDWLCHLGIKSYGMSYYSYFFLIAWFAVTLVFLYHLLKKNRIFLILACAVIALVTEMTMIGNQVYAGGLKEQQDKYDLLWKLIETDRFKEIEDDAQLYVPDYIGIHHQIGTIAEYANGRTGKQLTCTNEKEKIDYEKPVYYIKADTDKDVVYLCRVTEDGITDEIYVMALENVGGTGLLARREEGAAPAVLTVNGEGFNLYGQEIVTGNLGVWGREMLIQCKGMKAESAEVYEASDRMSNELISLGGIYGREPWGRWAEKEMTVCLNNPGEKEMFADFAVNVLTPEDKEAEFTVRTDEGEQKYTVNAETRIETELMLKPGENRITITSGAPDLEVEGDIRKLNFKVIQMEILMGDEQMDLMNLLSRE